MTLDLILFRPEFFLLFGFFVLLWLGTGNLVTPVAEILTIISLPHFVLNSKKNITNRFVNLTTIKQNVAVSIPLAQLAQPNLFGDSGLDVETSKINYRERKNNQNRGPNHAVSALTLWAIIWCFLSFYLIYTCPLHLVFLGGSFQKDSYSLGLCIILFITAFFVLRVSYGWQKVALICHTEYVYLAILALMGQYLLIIATDLMSLYLCMELQSFSLVVLCGLNSKSAYSLEAAIKYFLLSAFRSCLLLLGVGFIYWQTGETSLPHIEKIVERTRNNPSLVTALGIWLVSTGLLWKLAVAPLHFWVPDVYIGAWSSISLWITVLPKIAVLSFWTHHWHNIWSMFFGNTLGLFRAFSIIVGRIAPLAQTNIKRLLAYSSVGHMGILLMPLCKSNLIDNIANTGYSNMLIATPADSIGVLWAYIIIYVIINLGVWGMLFWPIYRPVSLFIRSSSSSNVNKQYNTQQTSEISTGQLSNAVAPQYLWDLKGINSSSARTAFRWGVFITSLAGLPPVYSFLGKAAIIWHRVNNGLFILVAIALRYTMVRSVYYLKVMKICYVDNPTSWASYGKVSPLTAYIVRLSVFIMLIGLWHGNALFLFTHLLAISAL